MVAYFDADVWRKLEGLAFLNVSIGIGAFLNDQIAKGRIVTLKDIYDDVKHRPDVKAWLDLVPEGVIDLNDEGLLCVTEIVNNYPDFIEPNKPSGRDSDPPFVAMALAHQRSGGSPTMVVTQEKPRRENAHRWHIPDVCASLGLPCGDFNDWLAWSGYRITVEPIP